MSPSNISDAVTDDAFEQALFGDESAQEVSAADTPATPSEDVEIANETESADGEPEQALEAEAVPDTPADSPAEKHDSDELPNFKDAPDAWKQLRDKYDTTRKELQETRQNSLQDKFFTNESEFLEDLNKLSPSQFEKTARALVKTGIDQHSKEFAAYLASVNPDAAAEGLFGEGITAAQAKKIIAQVQRQDLISYLDENDEQDAPAEDAAARPPARQMSDEEIQRKIDEGIKNATRPQEIERLEQQTYADIMKPVEEMLNIPDLTVLPTDAPEDRQFKEFARDSVVKEVFEYLTTGKKNATDQPNKSIADKYAKMQEFFKTLDEAGAKHLVGTAQILAEDRAGELIQMFTRQRAQVKTRDTKPKAEPPKVVPSKGTAFAAPQAKPTGRISQISADEFEAAGM